MKAVLVVDVLTLDDGRHLCNGCPIWNADCLFCEYDRNMKTEGCPLRPLPKEKEYERFPYNQFERVFNDGYNACLAEIDRLEKIVMGETE